MSINSYMQSPDFKRASTAAADNSAKVIFKWIGIFIGSLANFVKMMVMQIFGK